MTAIHALVERGWFLLSLWLGRLLRTARYSTVRIIDHDGQGEVRKLRFFYAPLLVRIGGLLMKALNTGVRVLPQRDWEERERQLHQRLDRSPIRMEAGGVLVLPRLAGQTLATVLENSQLAEPVRKRAIELAVVALVAFHRAGFTHGDAMAENVMIDLEGDIAHWIDFETIYEANRPRAWRRADDVRALLVTCLLRTRPGERAPTLQHILDVYGDDETTRLLTGNFGSALRRPLAFHLGQAGLSYEDYREIARLLRARANGGSPS